ncbi:MAG: YdiU family protein [Sedimenticolaceae bacterium]
MQFDNTYARLPQGFYARLQPERSPDPHLLAWNEELAEELGLQEFADDPARLAQLFCGNDLLPGSEPIALAYAGHQFGNFVPQLGDGRALLLGELLSSAGRRLDVQLKGSGQTPFSRRGDGRAALGPVIREYLVSEAMHRMGVPTTRALAAVSTGGFVLRDGRLPGGVLTRVASSHIRVGTFEFFAARRDKEALQTLADYAIARHYPEVLDEPQPLVAFFAKVLEAQASLVAHWMGLGFIHGVMNTDNTSISGETIDYGPCAFMDEFDYHKVFSSIDQFGRYAYGNQGQMAHWNLARLAETLMLLDDSRSLFEEQLARFQPLFEAQFIQRMARKLGLQDLQEGDDQLITRWLQQMQEQELDFTLSFRHLADRVDADDTADFGDFETEWRRRLQAQKLSVSEVKEAMNQVNPLFIPRNHQIERAIDAAIEGDMSIFNELRQVLAKPFGAQPELRVYAEPPRPAERVIETFCGT